MLLSRGSIYPFSHVSFRWSTLVARYDRSLFLFFLLSLPLPFVLTGGQRDILLLFCLLASISLRIPWAGPLQQGSQNSRNRWHHQEASRCTRGLSCLHSRDSTR